MATYAGKLRSTGVDGGTIRLNSRGELSAGGIMEPFSAGTLGGAPSVFYVDGNVVSSGNGLGWLSAFKTLAEGLLAAHTYMSTSGNRAWAQRATIYACGDALEEDLTVFAEKTDVIGVGTTNGSKHARLTGTHVLVATSSDTYHGCHWYNVQFYGQDGGVIMTIPANQNHQRFIDCEFMNTTTETIGIQATQSHDLKIIGCSFMPNTSNAALSTAAIKIPAGSCTNFMLRDSLIMSDGIGLDFDCTATQAVNCWVIDNIIQSVGMPIDSEDNSTTGGLLVVGNRCITDIDTTTVTAGYDFVLGRCVDNLITGKDECDAVPYVLQT